MALTAVAPEVRWIRRGTAVALGGGLSLAIVLFAVWALRGSHAPTPAAWPAPSVSGGVLISGGPTVPDGFGGSAPENRPVQGARLVAVGTSAAGVHLVRRAVSGRLGRFSLRLPPGRYLVAAILFGPRGRSLTAEPHARVTFLPGRPVHIRLHESVI